MAKNKFKYAIGIMEAAKWELNTTTCAATTLCEALVEKAEEQAGRTCGSFSEAKLINANLRVEDNRFVVEFEW